MDRLTQTGITYNFPKLDVSEINWLERVQNRLAYYEDLEEQGRLMILETREHQAPILQYYKNYLDKLKLSGDEKWML